MTKTQTQTKDKTLLAAAELGATPIGDGRWAYGAGDTTDGTDDDTEDGMEWRVEIGHVVDVYPDCDGEPQPADALSYYCSVEVSIDGETYQVGTNVGARDSDHGSIRAAGCDVRPYCTAWWEDASDCDMLPMGAREAVEDALIGASLRLYHEAIEQAS
jgi:hypothetical protein